MTATNETTPATESKAPVAPAPHPVAGLRNEIDRVFERFFHDPWGVFPARDWRPFGGAGTGLSPSAEMKETEAGYELEVELPGVDEADIEVTLDEGMLTLSGEKREERSSGEGERHFSERRYGAFRRSFTVPRAVQADDVKATFAKGVLTISIPKSEQAKAGGRRISVESG